MTDLVRPRAFWQRLLALAAFACALLAGRGAQAAAPMCSEHAESIAAPPIGTPASNAALKAERACDALTLMLDQKAPERQAPKKVTFEPVPDRVLPVVRSLSSPPLLVRLSAPAAEDFSPPEPLSRSVYRPPRA